MSEELEELRRKARPDDLASLRRLDRALQQQGWRIEGKSLREWISEFEQFPFDFSYAPDPVQRVSEAGLAAVPALVETLQTRHLSSRRKIDARIRSHCVGALLFIKPPAVCAIPALLETLRAPSADLRRLTLHVLAKLQPRPSTLAVRELLRCLRSRHEPAIRSEAAYTLSQLQGPLPPEVRRAALERLVDQEQRVRRHAIRILARLPAPDPELRTALEEQVILDDVHRLAAITALLKFDEPRALEFLREEVLRAGSSHLNERQLVACMQALRLIEQLGAQAEPLLPTLLRVQSSSRLETPLLAAIDGIVRGQLSARMRTPRPEQLRDERALRLLDAPPPQAPSEPPDKALARWAAGFIPHGRELCVRMALAVARRVVGICEAAAPFSTGPRQAIQALEDWVCDPSEASALRAVNEGNNTPSQLCAPDEFSASWAITFASLCVPTDAQREQWARHSEPLASVEGGFLGSTVLAACRALGSRSVIVTVFGAREEPSLLSDTEAAQEVRRAIQDELRPWLQGTWDPVVEVIQRRRELLPPPPALTGRYPP